MCTVLHVTLHRQPVDMLPHSYTRKTLKSNSWLALCAEFDVHTSNTSLRDRC